MNKYGPKASDEIEKVMHEFKEGRLTIGKSKQKVTSRDQAIAIGLDKARRKGGRVPSEED